MPYYICKMIGTGKEDDPYRPLLSDYRVNWVAVGQANKWAFCFVSNPSPELKADPQIHEVDTGADFNRQYTEKEYKDLENKLARINVKLPEFSKGITVREVLNYIGQDLEAAFDLAHFRVL